MKKWSLSGAEVHIFFGIIFNFTNVSAPLNDRKVIVSFLTLRLRSVTEMKRSAQRPPSTTEIRSTTEMKKWSLSGAEVYIFSWYFFFNFTNVSAPLNDRKVG
jgi:hypothetical protein